MANCLFLLNAGGNILLNAGGALQMNDNSCTEPTPTPTEGAQSGGRVRKKVGQQLISDNLGNRPVISSGGTSTARIEITVRGKSKSKLSILTESLSKAISIPVQSGFSMARLSIPVKTESKASIIHNVNIESKSIWNPAVEFYQGIRSKTKKLLKIQSIVMMAEQIDTLVTSPVVGFSFNETVKLEELIAFTHSSS